MRMGRIGVADVEAYLMAYLIPPAAAAQ